MLCSSCSLDKSENDFRPSELRRLARLSENSSKGTPRLRAKRSDVLVRCRACISKIDRDKWQKSKERGDQFYANRKAGRQLYYENNKDQFKALAQDHYDSNVKMYDFWRAKSRAKNAGATQFMNVADWETLRDSPACHWCGCELHRSFTHMDHVVALCQGGQHTVENVVASCANCNAIREWERKALLSSARQRETSRKEI